MHSMNLTICLENLRKMTEKETMRKKKYFKIKDNCEKKEEKINMVGRNYLRNKQQYDYKMNLRKKHTNQKVRKVVSKEEFSKHLDDIEEAEQNRLEEIEERKKQRAERKQQKEEKKKEEMEERKKKREEKRKLKKKKEKEEKKE